VRDVPDATDERLLALAREVSTQPFRLEESGPFRAVLLRRAADATLVVATHHIASDALSQRIIWSDLAAAYRAFAAGAEPEWPELTATYDDYVTQERRLIDSPRGPELAEYWRGICAGARPATLPTDRARPAQSAFRGATYSRAMPDELVERVHAAAAAVGVTPFTVILGAFQALLHRYTGENDLTIGCPATTRRTRALRDMVGLLVNTIVLRARFSPETTFADAIAEAGRQLSAGMARARYPFALLNTGRQGKEPLYRIAITMVKPQHDDTLPDNGDEVRELFPGHRWEKLDVPRLEGQFDLNVEITHMVGSMTVVFRYDTELFDRETVERLVDHLLRMTARACAEPLTRVAAVSLVDASERQRLLAFGAA
jgi:hypothetical protein